MSPLEACEHHNWHNQYPSRPEPQAEGTRKEMLVADDAVGNTLLPVQYVDVYPRRSATASMTLRSPGN